MESIGFTILSRGEHWVYYSISWRALSLLFYLVESIGSTILFYYYSPEGRFVVIEGCLTGLWTSIFFSHIVHWSSSYFTRALTIPSLFLIAELKRSQLPCDSSVDYLTFCLPCGPGLIPYHGKIVQGFFPG